MNASPLANLATPAALVDARRFAANCRRMAERADQLGVRLRPHVKTHKTREGATAQLAGRAPAITVSTLEEARFFAGGGFSDITYAVPITPQRLGEAVALVQKGVGLTLVVDHPASAAAASAAAAGAQVRLAVLLEVDCGGGRCGVNPDDPGSLALAARLARDPHLEFRGLLTHAGHAYACRCASEVAAVAAQERDITASFAERLRRAGVPVGEVSIGSTPTALAADHLHGVTEFRPGNYVFFDAFQAAIGSCRLADCAFSVLTTVLGCYPERATLVIDAGALALSRDPGPTHVDPACGFGVLCQVGGCRPIPGLRFVSLSQEHGVVRGGTAAQVAAFPPGTRLRVIPNHACLAAACFETYHVVEGEEVVGQWHPCRGW